MASDQAVQKGFGAIVQAIKELIKEMREHRLLLKRVTEALESQTPPPSHTTRPPSTTPARYSPPLGKGIESSKEKRDGVRSD